MAQKTVELLKKSAVNSVVQEAVNNIVGNLFKGSDSISNGAFLDTGKGSLVNVFIPVVRGVNGQHPSVICDASDYQSDGRVRIRYANISDGTENTGTHIIDWVAM